MPSTDGLGPILRVNISANDPLRALVIERILERTLHEGARRARR
jgi:hypothetical protein